MTIQTLNQSVAAELRGELARNELSQAWLAGRLGWNKQKLFRRMKGHTPFSTSDLERIAAVLEIPLSNLTRSWP